ncbi:hypothetical protein CK203_071644 [Vitis vinifera]|uniref:Endonuclease/exonuclease/phosphatase domain-containing protein n=1 Tax=Vitis vinifera TaxID=29760 RepID=A0A438F4C5_VITVI|nr:hypothetical protein CK203_071644 [Vitis vinifera]
MTKSVMREKIRSNDHGTKSLRVRMSMLGFGGEGLEKDIMDFLVKFVREGKEFIANPVGETKFERELRRLECSINYEGGKKQNGGDQNSVIIGGSGEKFGLWSLEVMETEVGKFSVSCRFRNVENGLTWIFTGVYGPFSKGDRECLWEELGAIRGLWEDPWCLGGDFNVILSQRERNRQGRLTGAMRIFAQTVDELELMDLPMQGGAFTWSGGRNNQSWARLDSFGDTTVAGDV